MQFPPSFNGRGITPQTPIIGETKQVPMVTFQIQVTPELMNSLSQYAEITGLDGVSLMNHVFTRGLVAIKQDHLNAQIEADSNNPDNYPEDEGTP